MGEVPLISEPKNQRSSNEIMDNTPVTLGSGFLALVSYIPGTLASFLHGLRQTLPGTDNPEPHITILPRRLLSSQGAPDRIPALDSASREARSVLSQFPAFEVELSTVRHFSETNILYLDVTDGNDRLHQLHNALNTGILAHPEEFEFRPHLTLSGPVSTPALQAAHDRATRVWAAVPAPKRFILEEVFCLWLNPDSPRSEWRRLWNQRLAAAKGSAGGAR